MTGRGLKLMMAFFSSAYCCKSFQASFAMFSRLQAIISVESVVTCVNTDNPSMVILISLTQDCMRERYSCTPSCETFFNFCDNFSEKNDNFLKGASRS